MVMVIMMVMLIVVMVMLIVVMVMMVVVMVLIIIEPKYQKLNCDHVLDSVS